MGRRARECYLCGREYQYCPTCSQDKMKPAWMSDFHSENCKTIFDICTRFNMNLMSKTEAQDALNACDLSNKENFKSYVQRDLEVVFVEDSIVVTLDAEIKETHEDKAIVETFIRGSKAKKPIQHEVVYKKENE
jgi:hypothetical protein